MLNLEHVVTFVAVLETGSFQAASHRLGCSQPTVSQHIRKIEMALQAPLVVRDRRNCRPTPEGETFLPYARSLLSVAGRARAAVQDPVLTIGASSNIGIYLLQPHMKAFQDSSDSETKVDLWIGANGDVAEKLERHEVDVAVMEWWDERPGFTASLWRREPMVLIVPPNHQWASLPAVPLDQLLRAPMIGGESGTGTGRILRDAIGDAADEIQVSLQLGSTEAVKHAVGAGLGVSVVLESAVSAEVDAGTLCALPLAGRSLHKPVLVIRRDGHMAGAVSTRFADYLLQKAAPIS